MKWILQRLERIIPFKNWIARWLVSEAELVKHLPPIVKPGTDPTKMIDFIRWNIAIGRIPRKEKS